MRVHHKSDDTYFMKELERLNAEKWMVDLLKLNPDYPHWGPHEDYMINNSQWGSPIFLASWKEFHWELDEYNECVNFYFELSRKSEQCSVCKGDGYHIDGKWISDSFYRHSSPFTVSNSQEELSRLIMSRFGSDLEHPLGRGTFPSKEILNKYPPAFREFCEEMRDGMGYWCDRLTEDEWLALQKNKRIDDATKFINNPDMKLDGFGHDAINRGILIEARCKRLGLPITCETCEGHGYVYIAPAAHVELVLWMLHPRKGCSRGIEIALIEKEDLPAVFKWLRGAADRNAERFSRIPND